MRKEFERPPVLCPAPEDAALLLHPAADARLTAVLAELGQRVRPLGIAALDQAGDGGAIAISENTNMGKIFAAIASNAGLAGCTLHRTQTVPENVQIVDGNELAAVVRTEIIQQLVHAEVGFFFAYVLQLAQPGFRLMAALPPEQRGTLFPALWHALGFSDAIASSAIKLAARIADEVDDDTKRRWSEQLEPLRSNEPAALGARYWSGVCCTARRAGLVAGADLRQVFRVMSACRRRYPPGVVARLDEIDEYVSTSEALQELVAFAAAPAFGQILRRARTVTEG